MDLDFETTALETPIPKPNYTGTISASKKPKRKRDNINQRNNNNQPQQTSSARKQYFKQRSQQLYHLSKHYTQGMFRSASCPRLHGGSLWLLGTQFNPTDEREAFVELFDHLLWFTYRRNFDRIGESHFTSDAGWGCMMRTGQMLLGEALKRKNNIHRIKDEDVNVLSLLTDFRDSPSAPFSIHVIAERGKHYEKEVGDWFGPGTMANVMRDLVMNSKYDDELTVYVSPMHGTLYINQVMDLCCSNTNNNNINNIENNNNNNNNDNNNNNSSYSWKPVILLIPLRVGLNEFNTSYTNGFLGLFHIPQTLGVMGGRPRHSVYFVGHQDCDMYYLDPHSVQDVRKETNVESYRCRTPRKMTITSIDPSCVAGFYCETETDFRTVCDALQELRDPVISVQRAPPDHSQIPDFDMSEDDEDNEEEHDIQNNNNNNNDNEWVKTDLYNKNDMDLDDYPVESSSDKISNNSNKHINNLTNNNDGGGNKSKAEDFVIL